MNRGKIEILALNAYREGKAGTLDKDVAGLIKRRQKSFGKSAVTFYNKPIKVVRAEGPYIHGSDGRRYLDFYNNVPTVGHTHPKVVAAVTRQIAEVNLHSRYLSDIVQNYGEALLATYPGKLGNLVMTCTGSEANDLALRIARKASGGMGFIVTEAAYHGNTTAVTEVSPSSYKTGAPPTYIRAIPAPDPRAYPGDLKAGFTKAVQGAIAALEADGVKFAGMIADTIFSSDGVFADPPGFLDGAVKAVRKAGGLFIADEVQPGFGRTGAGMWGFARHGVTPDIVTMGKPMGNGYPTAGLVTRPELLAAFAEDYGYFNTFAASQAAAAAGKAVLEIIAEEGLIANAASVGAYLRDGLRALGERHPALAEVRGAGLYLGAELCQGADFDEPAPELTTALIDGLRDRGILIGAAGRYANVLKIRPPLCVTTAHADELVAAMEAVLKGG